MSCERVIVINAKRNAKLLRQASELFTLGLLVERRREKIRRLVEKKIPCDAPQMKTALEEFELIDSEWKRLEQEHLDYRRRLVSER